MGFKHTFFGAAIGFITSGPIGALLGAVVGSLIGEATEHKQITQNADRQKTEQHKQTSEFTYSLLILFACVIKADQKTTKSEINFTKQYLVQEFGTSNAREMMQILKSLLEKEIDVKAICGQIRVNTDYYFRLELIHLLFKLAASDGSIDSSEFAVIRDVATGLSLGQLDFIRIASMFSQFSQQERTRSQNYNQNSYFHQENKIDNAYNILGVSRNADKDDVKSAFRKLSKEYHPDKVAHLGEEYQKIAKEKFIKIKEAYDLIMQSK